MREAVSRLQAEGLVETFQGRGSFVLAVPEPSAFALESSAHPQPPRRARDDRLPARASRPRPPRLAAARITPATAEAVRGGLDEPSSRPDARARSRRTSRSTERVAAATGNRFYVDLLDSLGPMMIMLPRTRLADAYSMTDATHVERVQREHDNIAAAVLAGDVETARAAMRVHLGNTRRRLDPQA